jgi:hypothetical protein
MRAAAAAACDSLDLECVMAENLPASWSSARAHVFSW